MTLVIANLNATDRIRVGTSAHTKGIAPPTPAFTSDIVGRDIVLNNVPTDQVLQIDNTSSRFRRGIDPAVTATIATAPLNVDLPSFRWATNQTGERHNHIMKIKSGSWFTDNAQAVTFVTELLHSDTTVLTTVTDTTAPDILDFSIGDQLHGVAAVIRVTATYDASGEQTVVTAPAPIPAYVEPPNLWLSMLESPDNNISDKGVTDFSFTFDPVTGDATFDFPTAPPASAGSPRVNLGFNLNAAIPHYVEFEAHAATEAEVRLIKLVIGNLEQIRVLDNQEPLNAEGFIKFSATMFPTEQGTFRFDTDKNQAPGTVILRNVIVKEQ